MNSSSQENLISTKEASRLSGYNPDYLSRLCRDGKISGRRIGRTWLVYQDSLRAFVVTQAEHKREIADSLARERKVEYRIATAALTGSPGGGVSHRAQRETRKAIRSVMGAFARGGLPEGPALFTGYGPSAALTALILSVGVLLAGTGLTARMGAVALTSAFDARSFALESLEGARTYALEKRSAVLASGAASRYAREARIEDSAAPGIAMAPEILLVHLQRPYGDASFSVPEHAIESSASKARATALGAWEAASTIHSGTTLASRGVRAMEIYRDIGYVVVRDVEAMLAAYERAITVGGETTLSIGNTLRISGTNGAHAVVTTYQSGLYAYVSHAEEIAEGIVGTTALVGDTLANTVSSGVRGAPLVYDLAIGSFIDNSEALAAGIAEESYAFGSGARNTVAYILEAEDRAVAEAVDAAGATLAGVAQRAQYLARSTATIAESLGTQTVLASSLAALEENELLSESFEYLSRIVARVLQGMLLPHAALHAVSEARISRIQGVEALIPVPTAISDDTTLTEAPGRNLVVHGGPVTLVRAHYPAISSGTSTGTALSIAATIIVGDLTIPGPVRESVIKASDRIAGPYVLATSTTATSAFSGNIAVGRSTAFGTTALDLLTINGSIASHATSSLSTSGGSGMDIRKAARLAVGPRSISEKEGDRNVTFRCEATEEAHCLSIQAGKQAVEDGIFRIEALAVRSSKPDPLPTPISKGIKPVFPGMEMNTLLHKKRTRKL